MLFFDSKIRTRTTFIHPVQFGEILYLRKKLYSFSFFEDNIIKEINFDKKTLEIWLFSNDGFLEKYEKFLLGINLPKISVIFRLRINTEGITEFDSIEGNHCNTAKIYQVNENLMEFSFDRVSSYLGHETNCYFGQRFILENAFIKETLTIKNNRKLGNTEIVKALSHKYQFKEDEIEKIAEKILKYGWNDTDVQQFIKNHPE